MHNLAAQQVDIAQVVATSPRDIVVAKKVCRHLDDAASCEQARQGPKGIRQSVPRRKVPRKAAFIALIRLFGIGAAKEPLAAKLAALALEKPRILGAAKYWTRT